MPPALDYANVQQAAVIRQAHESLAGCLFPGLATPALQDPLGMAQSSSASLYVREVHLKVRQKRPQDKSCKGECDNGS